MFEVTRLTVLSCISIAAATVFKFSGRKCDDAMDEEPVLLAHDFARDFQDRARALVEALHQP